MLPVMVHVCLQTRGTVLQRASTAAWYLPGALRTALRQGWKLSRGRGGLRLNKKGQQSSDVITALWGQGEICVSWLVNNWAETGLCCCQQVAFTAACTLHAMRVAAIVRLSTRAPPEVFLAVPFPSTWQCTASSPPRWGARGFLQAAGTPSLCSVQGAGACAGSVPGLFPVTGTM